MNFETPQIIAKRVKENMRIGKLEEASTDLEKLKLALPNDPTIFFTAARVYRNLGDFEAAERDFRKSVDLGNTDPSALAQFASLLADLQKPYEAIKYYDIAIQIAPTLLDAEIDKYLVIAKQLNAKQGIEKLQLFTKTNPSHLRALSNLAVLLREALRTEEAEDVISTILSIDKTHSRALTLKAQIAYDRGENSIQLFTNARHANPDDPNIILGQSAAFLQEREPEKAIELLKKQLNKDPLWKEGHFSLSQIRWQMTGEESFTKSYENVLKNHPGALHLWTDYIIAISRAMGYQKSLDVIEAARTEIEDQSFLDRLAANSLAELGRFEEAETIFTAYEDSSDFNFQLPYLRYLCLSHKFDRAQTKGLALAKSGYGAHTWPYISMAWRMLDDDRWNWLEAAPEFVKVTDVEAVQPLLPDLTERIRALHTFKNAPYNQSLRDGTQSDGTLFYKQFPEIKNFIEIMNHEIEDYLHALPAKDETHPLLSLNRDQFKFNGSWSVRLTSSGFHVNHIHSEGSISSAFYVSLPESLGTGENGNNDGWLAVGEPAKEFKTGLKPLRMVQPKPGRLVLFPSTMWHGTRPFSNGERLTIAFDTLLMK